MKKIRTLNTPPKERWVKNNPDALATTPKDLFGESWSEVVDNVTENGSGVVLIQRNSMIGVIVPIGLLDKFYESAKGLEIVDPVTNVSEGYFKENFEACASSLTSGKNLMVSDKSGKLSFGVVCKEFTPILETNNNGVIGFKKNVFKQNNECDLSTLSY